ncbi:branched-chain amino acid ABC transporter permease [Streptosporangium canum]|uniref:branched-chain amino acid ABC transporter permease n=1 Tax=Streptosporangium canum TaxID=324952 RepID=UPI0034246CF6
MFENFHNLATQFWPQTVDGLIKGSIYGLVALGYTMVYGVLRLINFAHSEIFMIGTMASLAVLTGLGVVAPATGVGLIGLLILMAVVSMAASGGAAVLLEQIAYRPLRKRGSSRLAALISAIGASLFLMEFFALVVIPWLFDRPGQGKNIIGVKRFLARDEAFSIGDVVVRNDQLLVFLAAVMMMILLDLLVNRTKMGRGIRATAQDPQTAVLMGVNIDRIVRLTFLIGGAMAGIAGMLYLLEYEVTKFNVGFLLGIKAFTAAVLGGIGNIRGALLGGFVLGLVENYGAAFFGTAWLDVVAFVILVLVLLFRPTGILGESLQVARA